MPDKYITRTLEPILKRSAREFPAVILTGPRQYGKTTLLQRCFGNSKRLVKTPKVYFTDTGTLCYLSGLKDPEHAASGPMGGAIMETAVLSEIYKASSHHPITPSFHHSFFSFPYLCSICVNLWLILFL
jgi:predicted AAA+ superfamily ATPase